MKARHMRLLGALLLVLGMAGLRVAPAHAATAVSACPTSEAELSSNIATAGDGGTVSFTCNSDTTIYFDSNNGHTGTGPILVSQSVTLDASSATGKVTLDGGNSVPLFWVTSDVNLGSDVNPGVTLVLRNLTVQHAFSWDFGGGAIRNLGGTVTISSDTFSNNSADSQGGAIFNDNAGTVTITDSTVSGNAGGAIDSSGRLTITNSTFSGNSAPYGFGGAISNSGALTVTDSTLSGNSATNGFGGAISNYNGGTVTITGSTLSGNSATSGGAGGAVSNQSGTVTVTDSALSGNSASGQGGAIENSGRLTVTDSTLSDNSATNGFGGAISNDNGTVIIAGSTVVGNSALDGGGAIVNGAALTITNSTLSGNSAPDGFGGAIEDDPLLGGTANVGGGIIANNSGGNCTAPTTDNGYNLEDDPGASCGFSSANHDIVGQDPKLDSLANNGGPTQTMALQSTSPAIDQIPAGQAGCPPAGTVGTDQRGTTFPRPDEGETVCDIGAYESAYGYHGPNPCPATEAELGTDIPSAAGSTFILACNTPTTVSFSVPITITGSVTLDASSSPAAITFDGGGSTQLFQVQSGASLTLEHLTLTHGNAPNGMGGAIASTNATLTIIGSTLSGNRATYGGAIGIDGGSLALSDSTLSGDSASQQGGAVFNSNSDSFGNTYPAGTVTIANSTLSSNSSLLVGGAILNAGTLSVSNSTLSGNSAVHGGAIASGSDTNNTKLTVNNSTLYGNSTSQDGAAVTNAQNPYKSYSAAAEIGGTIIANSTGGACYNTGTITDDGYNLTDSTSSCGLSGKPGDLTNTDPQLDPNGLQSNGGPTPTIALESGSPAIDQIPTTSSSLCPTGGTDQRGNARPDDNESLCDIGAYESAYTSQATTLSLVSGSGTYGGSATLTASLTSGSGNISGETIGFTLDGNAVCGGSTSVTCPTTNSSGVATLSNVSLPGINAGAHAGAVGASFAGDTSYNSATGSGDLTISPANQTISVTTQAPANAGYNTSFTVAATASSGLPVTFGSSGSCTNSGATVTMTSSTGSCTVTYDQAGDSNYNAATEVSEGVNAQKADQSISFGALSNKTYGDAPFTVGATASSGLLVSFSVGSTDQCTISGTTVTITGAGSCTVTASQGGDSNYNASSSVSQTFSIAKAAATITLDQSGLGATYDGNPHPATATTSPGGLSYSVGYTDSSNTAVTNPTNAGSYGVTATITDPNYQGSTTGTLVISKANQTITVSTSAPGSATYNATFTVGASAGSGLGIAYGSSGSCSNVGASYTMTSGTGTCTVTLDQVGNSNYTAAPEVTETVNAQAANQTITFPAISNKTYGDPDFVPGATASSALPVGYITAGACSIVSGQVHITGAGSCTVTATQAGNSNYNPATSVAQGFTINQAGTTTSLTSSVNPSLVKQNVTFTAQVTSAAGTPGGTVTFKDGTTTLASGVTLNSSGVATLTTSTLTAGTHSITASYSGTTNYQSSTSATLSQQVRYGIKVLSTSGLTMALQLQDYTGANVSASTLTVTAECVVPYATPDPTTCGPSPIQTINKAFGFLTSYKGMGPAYSYSVNSHGLTKGQPYDLVFKADGDPIWHAVAFTF